MVAERHPEQNGSYEEQVAAARASLERNLEEHRKRVEAWRAEHGDPAVALDEFVRQTFDRDALLTAWRDWIEEQGHSVPTE